MISRASLSKLPDRTHWRMSLKNFHIAFITVCTLFFAGLGAWCLLTDMLPEYLRVMGWLSIVCGVLMLIYGIRFLKKTKYLHL